MLEKLKGLYEKGILEFSDKDQETLAQMFESYESSGAPTLESIEEWMRKNAVLEADPKLGETHKDTGI